MRNLLLTTTLALAGCTGYTEPEFPEPGEVMAGIARTRIPAPLGIGTVGNGPFGAAPSASPYSEIFPGTRFIHGHPDFKIVVISRGDGNELVFVRSDTIGVFQQIRQAIVLEVKERSGRDIDDALIFGGTHTHSGPGRIVDGGGPFDIIADKFLPEFYLAMVDSIVSGILEAYDDLQPARVGWGAATNSESHNDRRCEDGEDYENGDAPFIAVERGGQIEAIVMSYAVHGTIIGIDDHHLSSDAAGGIEHGIEIGFDHPVNVLMFNSWGGDMSVGSPSVPSQPGADWNGSYERMDQLGYSMGQTIHAALPSVAWEDDPTIYAEAHRVELSVPAIGYEEGVFEYPYGGVYCGQGAPDDCDVSTVGTEVGGCVPFTEEFPGPNQTTISAGRIGALHFVTFPGEAVTEVGETAMDGIYAANPDVAKVMFFGYTQDYNGYSVLEDDYWQGGYEAAGGMWGPLQGTYLRDFAIESFRRTFNPSETADALEPAPIWTFDVSDFEPVVPDTALEAGTVETQVNSSYTETDIVHFAVNGVDPWLGAPLAHLETASGDAVAWPNGVPMDSDDMSFWVELTQDPPWSDEDAGSRKFTWNFHMPVAHKTPGGTTLSGDYRIRVEVPDNADVISETFTIP